MNDYFPAPFLAVAKETRSKKKLLHMRQRLSHLLAQDGSVSSFEGNQQSQNLEKVRLLRVDKASMQVFE